MISSLVNAWPTTSELRLLAALCGERSIARSELLRRCGESHSVIAAVEARRPEWFQQSGSTLAATELAEEVLRKTSELRSCSLTEEEHVRRFQAAVVGRPTVARELDQVHATPLSVVRRARKLVEDGQLFAGAVLLGDDDLTTLALGLLTQAEHIPLRVIEIDARIAAFLRDRAKFAQVIEHDLRQPLPKSLSSVRVVVSDPPYAPEGFALFASRASQILERSDGYFYVSFGWSGRATERGLQKQSLLTDCGFLAEEILPRFTVYEGAETLGAASALWVCRVTPKLRSVPVGDKDIYTRRKPRAKK